MAMNPIAKVLLDQLMAFGLPVADMLEIIAEMENGVKPVAVTVHFKDVIAMELPAMGPFLAQQSRETILALGKESWPNWDPSNLKTFQIAQFLEAQAAYWKDKTGYPG